MMTVYSDSVPENNTDNKENCNKYLNYDISIDEVETVLQQLKKQQVTLTRQCAHGIVQIRG